MGNYGCGCSDLSKEEVVLDQYGSKQNEEIVEFQPDVYTHVPRSLFKAVEYPTSFDKSQSLLESKSNSIQTEQFSELQGELFRYQLTTKEIMVPRWCVLTLKTFKYFKNQFSAHCKEKPLFETSNNLIAKIKPYSKGNKHFIEISVKNKMSLMVLSNSNGSFLSEKSNGSNKKSFKHAKSRSIADKNEETIVFLINDKEEWIKWQKCFELCIKLLG